MSISGLGSGFTQFSEFDPTGDVTNTERSLPKLPVHLAERWDGGEGVICDNEPYGQGAQRLNCEGHRVNGDFVGSASGYVQPPNSQLIDIGVINGMQGTGAGTAILRNYERRSEQLGADEVRINSLPKTMDWYGRRGYQQERGKTPISDDRGEYRYNMVKPKQEGLGHYYLNGIRVYPPPVPPVPPLLLSPLNPTKRHP